MAEPIELSTEPLQEPVASCDTAISCLARLTAQNGGARIEAARGSIDLANETLSLSRLGKLAAEFGLQAQSIQLDWQGLKTTASAQPLLVVRNDGDVVVVTGGGRSGAEEVSVWDPHHDGVVFFVSREDFERAWAGHALIITPVHAEANVVKLRPGRETTPDTAGDDSPTHPDVPKQQTPPSPMRTARVSKSSRRGETLRRSPGLPLGLAAAAIVAAAGIALFLLTAPDADHIVSPRAPVPVKSAAIPGTFMNGREAAPPAGVVATSPVVGTSETTSTPATSPSAGPANKPGDTPPIGAPTREASLAAPPAEAAPSTKSTAAAPAAQMPEAVPPAPSAGPLLSGPEIVALVARGDALFGKGDLAAARLLYERAADAGDGQAAVRLGETFDPVFLDHAHLSGVRGDSDTAMSWYRRARDLGAADADVLIKSLEAK
jgi:hypothetical protein